MPHLPALAVLRLNHNLIATPSAGRLSPLNGGGGGSADTAGEPLQSGIGSLLSLEVLQSNPNPNPNPNPSPNPNPNPNPSPNAKTTPSPDPTPTPSPTQVLQLGYNQISDLPALRLHGLLQLKALRQA